MGKIDSWITWLDDINLDVRDLLFARVVYRQIGELVNANSRIRRPSHFYDFLRRTYATHIAMGVRRQVDRRKDVQSLLRLLQEIAGSPEYLSRQRYVDLIVDSAKAGRSEDLAQMRAEQEFDERHGRDAKHVSADSAKQDAHELVTIAANVKAHVDVHLAHLGRGRSLQQPATFEELDDSLDRLSDLVAKYMLELKAVTYQVEPALVGPWLEIFRVPWIDDDR